MPEKQCESRNLRSGDRCEKPAGHDSFCWQVGRNGVLVCNLRRNVGLVWNEARGA